MRKQNQLQKLSQIFFVISQTPESDSKVEVDKVAEILEQGVQAGFDLTFEADLMIPERATSSNSEYCDIIEVTYELEVVAVVEGFHLDFEITVPITVLSAPMGSATRIEHSNFALAPTLMIDPTAPPVYDLRKFFNSDNVLIFADF